MRRINRVTAQLKNEYDSVADETSPRLPLRKSGKSPGGAPQPRNICRMEEKDRHLRISQKREMVLGDISRTEDCCSYHQAKSMVASFAIGLGQTGKDQRDSGKHPTLAGRLIFDLQRHSRLQPPDQAMRNHLRD